MTQSAIFALLAALMTLATTVCLLRPLLRSRGHHGVPGGAARANLMALQSAAMALDAALARGDISPHEHGATRDELRARVLAEQGAPGLAQGFSGPARGWATAIGLALPVLALTLYATLGSPQALTSAPATAERGTTPASLTDVEVMVNQLAQQLQNREAAGTRDAGAWAMLARSLAALRRFEDADDAYQRAIALTPDDADLLADRADVLRMLPGATRAAEADRLIARALQLAPRHPKALALAGSTHAAPAPAVLRGRLEIAASLRQRVQPDDTVFVVARAAQGPRMPLALAQFRARDLPLTFTLDDRNAMMPGLSLSQYPDVVLSARVSRSGTATPASGDLTGQTAAVRTGAFGIVLRIDGVQP